MHAKKLNRRYRKTLKIAYPNNQGISGEAFQQKQIKFCNDMAKDNIYEGDIDNQSDIKDVRNYLIGPVFPHKRMISGDKFPEFEYNRKEPIGVLQLLNKKDYQRVTDFDIRKFKAIQDLIGLSIDKVSETHSTVNMRIGIHDSVKAMGVMMKDPEVD